MRIIVVGASGTIGKCVTKLLRLNHEVITAGSKSGDIQVDITSLSSIQSFYKKAGDFDALVCTAGNGHFGAFEEMKEEDFYKGIKSKMMGQINLVMEGKNYIKDNGSFTLTSGILFRDPVKGGVGLSFLNGALHSFVIGAAIELQNGIRLNVVSPGLVEDSATALGQYFPGHIPVPMNKVAQGYLKSVEGALMGQIIEVL